MPATLKQQHQAGDLYWLIDSFEDLVMYGQALANHPKRLDRYADDVVAALTECTNHLRTFVALDDRFRAAVAAALEE